MTAVGLRTRCPRGRWITPLVVVASLSGVQSASAASVVAVFPVEDRSLEFDAKQVEQITDVLVAEVVRTGRYAVVPRAELEGALKLQKERSYAACIDESCQIELGRELAAQKTLQTRILRIGDQCLMTSTLYDLRSATADWARSERLDCRLEAFLNGIERLAQALGRPSEPAPTEVASHTSAGRRDAPHARASEQRSAGDPSVVDAWFMVAPSFGLALSGFYGGGLWLELVRLGLGESGLVWSIFDGGVLVGSGLGGSFRTVSDGLTEHRSFHLGIQAGSRITYQLLLGESHFELSLGAGAQVIVGDTASYDRGAYLAMSPGLAYRRHDSLSWGVGLRAVIPVGESCDGSPSISDSVQCSARGPARVELQLPVWF